MTKGATRGAKGAEAPPPLAKSKLRKYEVLIFSRFHAYNPIKILLQRYHTSQLSNFVEFKLMKERFLLKYWIFLNFLRLDDPKLRELANFRS